MKNSLMIPLIFIINLVIWVCSISFFSVLGSWRYLDALVTGNMRLFFLICGYRAVYLLPLGIMLGLLFVFFFLMRHHSLIFISIPLVFALVAVSVVFILPSSYTVLSEIEARFPDAIHTIELPSTKMFSAGVIRTDRAGTRWTDISASGERNRTVVTARTAQSGDVLSFHRDARYDAASQAITDGTSIVVAPAGGIDPLYADYLALPLFVRTLVADSVRLLSAFRLSNSAGFIPFLWCAGSFFLAVTALWILCYLTGWRMLNVLVVCAFLRFLFLAFPHTVSGPLYDTVLKFKPDFFPKVYISPCFYLTVSALLVLVGAVVFLARKLRHAGSEATYV